MTGEELASSLPKALLPKEMSEAYHSYYSNFKEIYPDRCLLVLPHLGSGEVTLFIPCNSQVSYTTTRGQTYLLLATTPQLLILNLFNGT
jgi:hypothetical protein